MEGVRTFFRLMHNRWGLPKNNSRKKFISCEFSLRSSCMERNNNTSGNKVYKNQSITNKGSNVPPHTQNFFSYLSLQHRALQKEVFLDFFSISLR